MNRKNYEKYEKKIVEQALKDNGLGNLINPNDEICEIIEDLEWKYNIKILIASECGSREYGFFNEDSDYNIRFIYLQKPKEYLKINKPKTNIKYSENEFNFIGWDITKAYKMHQDSNMYLYEMLNSSTKYKMDENLFKNLETYNLNTLKNNYKKTILLMWRKYKEDVWSKMDKNLTRNYLYIIKNILCWKRLHYNLDSKNSIKESLNDYENMNIPKGYLEYVFNLIDHFQKEASQQLDYFVLPELNAFIHYSILEIKYEKLKNNLNNPQYKYDDKFYKLIINQLEK